MNKRQRKTLMSLIFNLFVLIGSICLIFMIISGSFFMPLSKGVVYSLQKDTTNGKYVYGEIESKQLTSQTIDYLNYNGELPQEMTDNEKSHMEDVRRLFNLQREIFFTSMFFMTITLMGIFMYFENYKKKALKRILFAPIYLLAVMIGLFIIISFNFQFFFSAFHQLFFPQGNYLFPIDSMLLTLFSAKFFFYEAIIIFSQIILLSIICIALRILLFKRKVKRKISNKK